MTIGSRSPRLRCWREATGATTPYYGFRAHRSLPHGVPAERGCFRKKRSARPGQARRRICAGKIRMRAGCRCFHIQPKTELVLEQESTLLPP
jgi:hypothetical protein